MKKELTIFECAIQSDAEILGILYTGSLGRGTADRFSDLDIVAWVADSFSTEVAMKLTQTLSYLGEIHFAYGGDDWQTGFVGPDWRRVDLDFRQRADLKPNTKYAQAQVIKDTDGFLADLVASSSIEEVTATPTEIKEALSEAIDSQIYLALHNARGATWSAMDEVAHRSKVLYMLLAQMRGYRSYGFRYVEDRLSAKEQAMLTDTWPAEPAVDEVRRAARALWIWTRYVWAEAEIYLSQPLSVSVDEVELLAAVDRIYGW